MSTAAQPDALTALLEKHDVRRAVVIDDVFDIPVADYIERDALDEFAAKLEAEPGIVTDLEAAELDHSAILRLDEPALKALAGKRDRLLTSRAAVEALLFDYLAQLGSVDALVQHLKTLKIDVTPLGADEDIPEGLTSQIAFIDYYLDGDPPARRPGDLEPTREVKISLGRRAREKAQKIYDRTHAHIVLMSNQADVAGLEAEFQQEAKLLKGYFRFQEKQSLADQAKLRALLTMLPLTADFRHALHDFVDCLEKRTKMLVGRFMDEVRKLGLEDYAHLRQLSLNHEGQPFGDYTVKLFGAFLTSLVLEDETIAEEVGRLDDTTFESLLPIVSDPSTTLGRVYLASLTERLRRPIQAPAVAAGTTGSTGSTAPTAAAESAGADSAGAPPAATPAAAEPEPLISLELGDLFVRNVESPVYAVMNPACDLPVAAGRGRERDDTVLLLPGALGRLHEPPTGKRPPTLFTPMYLHDRHVYRIDWDYRKLRTIPHEDIPSLLAEGYRCERRLHLGPALELQQHFTAETGRVGLPVPPPIGRSIELTVYCKNAEGAWAALTPVVPAGAVVFHMRDRDQFVIPDPAKERLVAMVEAHVVTLREATSSWQQRGHYATALKQAAGRWRTNCPFHRAFGALPGGRTAAKGRSQKVCELKDKLGVVVGTSFLTVEKVEADVVLSLALGPMPMPEDDADLSHEMDELQ